MIIKRSIMNIKTGIFNFLFIHALIISQVPLPGVITGFWLRAEASFPKDTEVPSLLCQEAGAVVVADRRFWN